MFHIFGLVRRSDALDKNQDLEFERNKERFVFLKVSLGYELVYLLTFPMFAFSFSISRKKTINVLF